MLLAFAAGTVIPAQAAARGLPLIRDAEIEQTIRAYTAPMFGAIGVSRDSVRVHIVNNGQINAFVAGGRHIFINTGLLMSAKDEPTDSLVFDVDADKLKDIKLFVKADPEKLGHHHTREFAFIAQDTEGAEHVHYEAKFETGRDK